MMVKTSFEGCTVSYIGMAARGRHKSPSKIGSRFVAVSGGGVR